ncbi:hypothetical protein QVD99_007142 [Batrachochytrium dendrobatidis]|nr:hypothetical protein QVD99_007142 [Batrachochytrium dendrobatidis]
MSSNNNEDALSSNQTNKVSDTIIRSVALDTQIHHDSNNKLLMPPIASATEYTNQSSAIVSKRSHRARARVIAAPYTRSSPLPSIKPTASPLATNRSSAKSSEVFDIQTLIPHHTTAALMKEFLSINSSSASILPHPLSISSLNGHNNNLKLKRNSKTNHPSSGIAISTDIYSHNHIPTDPQTGSRLPAPPSFGPGTPILCSPPRINTCYSKNEVGNENIDGDPLDFRNLPQNHMNRYIPSCNQLSSINQPQSSSFDHQHSTPLLSCPLQQFQPCHAPILPHTPIWHPRIVQLDLQSVPGFTKQLPQSAFFPCSSTPNSLQSSNLPQTLKHASNHFTHVAPFLLNANAVLSGLTIKPVSSAAALVRANATDTKPFISNCITTTHSGHAVIPIVFAITVPINSSQPIAHTESLPVMFNHHALVDIPAVLKPSYLFDQEIERETVVYRHMNTTHHLDGVVGQMLFSGFSTSLPPLARRRSRHAELCRVLVVALTGSVPSSYTAVDPLQQIQFRSVFTHATPHTWSLSFCHVLLSAYELLWSHGVLHRIVAEQNILFANVGCSTPLVRLFNFSRAVMKHESKKYGNNWEMEVKYERRSVELLCSTRCKEFESQSS